MIDSPAQAWNFDAETFSGDLKEEFERDWKLAKDLGAISDALNQLTQGVDHTLTAARSDTLMAALDIYAAVKLHRDRVPGLPVVADRLSTWFKRTPAAAKVKKA